MSVSRALPSGGRLHTPANVPMLSLQAVDKPNPNGKFSRVSAPQSNKSTVFDVVASALNAGTPRTGKRCQASNASSRAPSPEVSPRSTLRITRFDQDQQAAARHKEDNPRALRRMASPSPSAPSIHVAAEVDPVISANGLSFPGGKRCGGEWNKNAITMANAQPVKNFSGMERFKASARLATPSESVLRPETLPTHIPEYKVQRFRSSPEGRSQSLVGVLVPDTQVRAPPSYRPRAPFHTDE